VEDGRSLHGIQPLAGGRQPGAQAGVRSLVERAGVLELGGGRRLPGGRRPSVVKREVVRWREKVAGKERWRRSTRTDGGGERTGWWEHECRCFESPPMSKFLILRVWLGWCA